MIEAFPVTWDDPTDANLSWEREEMHFPNPLLPLRADAIRHGFGIEGFNYMYTRMSVPMRLHCRVLNGFVYVAQQVEGGEGELPDAQELLKEARRSVARDARQHWTDKVLPTLLETYQWMQTTPLETAPFSEIAHAWDNFCARVPHLWGLHFMTTAGPYQALEDLADLYATLVEEAYPGEALMLVAGLPNDLQRVQSDLYHLAEHARSLPVVAELILATPSEALLTLPSALGGEKFLVALRGFLSTHGHLGGGFEEPSWQDNPTPVLVEVCKRLQHPIEDPESQRQRLAAAARALADQVRTRLRERPEDLGRFEAALALAREVGPLTEEHNYWLDQMLGANTNRFVVRVGKRLAQARLIDNPDDVFYLHIQEIGATLREPHDLRELIATRKTEQSRLGRIRPPKHLGKKPPVSAKQGRFYPDAIQQIDERILRGIGASAGTGRGPARVVLSSEGFDRVQPGDVLVCPASNPSWVPLFGIIAGLITDTGGVTSHAAVVAREFGVPAVVGTGEATQRLRDGQQVEIDGTAGVVRLF